MSNNSWFTPKARLVASVSIAGLLAACGGGGSSDSLNQQSATNVQAGTSNAQSATNSTQPTANNTQQATDSVQSTGNSAQLEADNGAAASDTLAAADSQYHLYVSPNGSDSNPGTQAAPFKTIQKAASVVKPSTTVHVAPGTYAEKITSSISGTSSGRIRFVSDTKWGAKIVPSSSSATNMWTVSGGYTDIIGFEVDGSGNSVMRIAVALSGGNSSVQNSHVHHVGMTTACDSQGGAGLWASQSRGASYNNYDFTGNTVHHVGGTCAYYPSIYHQSTGNIKNNVVYAGSYAIHLYHDDHNVNIVNNTVFGNSGYGILFGGCYEAYNNGCPTSGIRVYNNIVYDNGGGIAGTSTAYDVGNDIKNNLVYGNKTQYDLASPSLATFSGMIVADPQFVNYSRTGGGDYRLKSTSPAINKSLSSYAPATDINGTARIGAADIGAYESY